jgi:adenine nucleotide transporter 17
LLTPKNEAIGAARNVLIAAIAGALNVLVTNPLWTVTTQLTLQKHETFTECCQRLYKENGITAFYAGVESSLMLVSNPIIQFVCYEQFRKYAVVLFQKKNLGAATVFLIGALAKAIATVLTYPLLVAKSKLQAPNQDKEADEFGNDTISVIRHVVKVEGFVGLFRGIDAKLTQSVLQSAFMFVAYERILWAILRLLRRK